jgi:hypothetical protein
MVCLSLHVAALSLICWLVSYRQAYKYRASPTTYFCRIAAPACRLFHASVIRIRPFAVFRRIALLEGAFATILTILFLYSSLAARTAAVIL